MHTHLPSPRRALDPLAFICVHLCTNFNRPYRARRRYIRSLQQTVQYLVCIHVAATKSRLDKLVPINDRTGRLHDMLLLRT